ncbi:MAG TPA: DUF4058 family protein, partial [Gemmataceae bacterium]
IGRQLSPKLAPKYVARSARRIVIATPDPTELPVERLPDVAVVQSTRGGAPAGAGGAVAAPLLLEALVPIPIPQTTVEVWDVQGKRLVTAIEVISPTNKRGDGRREYERKRHELLHGPAHLMEVDLIRVGRRFPVARRLPRVPYFVFLSRANRRGRVEVWPVRLDRPLPTVPVPLLPGDADVSLNLQSALSTVYDIYRYDETTDYRTPPPGRLARADRDWLDDRLREQGRRP